MYIISEIIRKKRDNQILSKSEIDFFIQGVTNSSIPNEQIASFTMAIFLNKLTTQEKTDLTISMKNSGSVIKWDFDGIFVDKHSTGGVGDLVSFLIAPILASFSLYVPMIAGRGLGHTGGTLDKLDSIAGYNTSLSLEKFQHTVKTIGCSIIGQTSDLAPADKKIYAIRDVSATVESIDLITASILSKKLAEGINNLVMDVKVGSGAFMDNLESATALAQSIASTSNNSGVKCSAFITDMNEPLADNIGNSLEIKESISYLQNKSKNSKLHAINIALCSEILVNTNICKSKEEAETKINQSITSGKALEIFAKMIHAQGANSDFIDNYNKYLPQAKIVKDVYLNKEGYISKIDTRKVGLALVMLKGGRQKVDDKLDYSVGFSNFKKLGDFISPKDPLCQIHINNLEDYNKITSYLEEIIETSTNKNSLQKISVYDIIK